MLSIVKKVQGGGTFDQSRTPDKFQEEVEVSFKGMNDSESVNFWLPRIFFDHDIYCVAPSSNRESTVHRDVEKIGEALKEYGVVSDGFVMSKVAAGWRGGGSFFPSSESRGNCVTRDVR